MNNESDKFSAGTLSDLKNAIQRKKSELHQLQKKVKQARQEKLTLEGQIASINVAEKEHENFLKTKRRVLFGFRNRASKFLQDSQEAQLMIATPAMNADIHGELVAIKNALDGIVNLVEQALVPQVIIQECEIIDTSETEVRL